MDDGISTWPRERIAAAVGYARKVGGLGPEPLNRDVGEWTDEVRGLIEAFDWYVRTKPEEAALLLEIQKCEWNREMLNSICCP